MFWKKNSFGNVFDLLDTECPWKIWSVEIDTHHLVLFSGDSIENKVCGC